MVNVNYDVTKHFLILSPYVPSVLNRLSVDNSLTAVLHMGISVVHGWTSIVNNRTPDVCFWTCVK